MRETLDIEIKQRLDALTDRIELDIAEQEKSVIDETKKISKEYINWISEKNEKGLTRPQVRELMIQRKTELIEELKNLMSLDKQNFQRQSEILGSISDINNWLLEYEVKENELKKSGADAEEQRKKIVQVRKNFIQNKLQEFVGSIEKEISICERKKEMLETLKNNNPDMYFDSEVNNMNSNLMILNSYLVSAKRMIMCPPTPSKNDISQIVDGLDGKDKYTDELFTKYLSSISKYGKLSKKEIELNQNNNSNNNNVDNNMDDDNNKDDSKKENQDIIDLNSLNLNTEELPQLPQNIHQKPEKTWKTVASVALGIGAAAGTFAAFGTVGSIIVMVASGFASRFIKKKERKIKESEHDLEVRLQQLTKYDNESQQLKDEIAELVEEYNSTTDEENKTEIEKKINQKRDYLAKNNELINSVKTKMEEITKRIYPDLKADEYNGPKKITSIEDANEKIKAKGRKFKAYLGSKQGLRDVRWFMNSAFITSGVLLATEAISNAINSNIGAAPEVVEADLSSAEIIDAPTSEMINPSPEPGLYDGIEVGGSTNGYNLSVGHDTASWAIDGSNAESLISEYANSTNTIFKGFRIQSGNGTIPLDLKGMNLTEFLNANPGIDPSSIVADVASKDGISQAWISIDELVSGLGGKSL